MVNTAQHHRDTILVDDAEILSHEAKDGNQFILTLKSPAIAKRAKAGQFVHIRCGIALPMRRPLSIMNVNEVTGVIELLYKVFGEGTRILSQRHKGETLSLLGPIGVPFKSNPKNRRPLLIGGGVGIPPMVFLANEMHQSDIGYRPFVIMGSEVPFPFKPVTSKFVLPSLPEEINKAMPIMEDWGIPSRLASTQGYIGSHNGYVTDLARLWLDSLNDAQRNEVEIFSCGPHPMLAAVAKLAQEYDLPCQVSLEEYMACAVGGCAGCIVKVETPAGPAMKRVCVDGPVFDASTVFPNK